jgi:hypothetical protein
LEKIGGHIPLIVIVFDDGGDVFQTMALQYSDLARTEEIISIDMKHRRKPEFCCMLGLTAGGNKKYNVHERNVFYEKQRRALSKEGVVLGKLELAGVTMHNTRLTRTELFRVLDNPEAEAQGGIMGHANPNCLNTSLFNFKSTHKVFSYLLNQEVDVRDEASSKTGYADAEKRRGKPGWYKHAQQTGFKFMMVQEAGSSRHDLPPDPTQSQFARLDYERMHFKGICTVLFRDFVLSHAGKAEKLALADRALAIAQPAGTKPIRPLIKLDKEGAPKLGGGEKLHQKKHWREHRMLSDLYPMFPEGHKMHKVMVV